MNRSTVFDADAFARVFDVTPEFVRAVAESWGCRRHDTQRETNVRVLRVALSALRNAITPYAEHGLHFPNGTGIFNLFDNMGMLRVAIDPERARVCDLLALAQGWSLEGETQIVLVSRWTVCENGPAERTIHLATYAKEIADAIASLCSETVFA